jgi:hypothetical protein
MAEFLTGNDGSVSILDTPSASVVDRSINVRVWAANVALVSSDLSGFGHSGKVRRLGIADITGSLAGTPTRGLSTPFGTYGSTNIPNSNGAPSERYMRGTVSLFLSGTATNATNAVALVFDGVFSAVAFNVDKNGESSVTSNFEMSDDNGPTVVWSTA